MTVVERRDLEGTRRPIVDKEIDVRVAQYAEKNDLSKKEAYREIIEFVVSREGNVKTENIKQ